MTDQTVPSEKHLAAYWRMVEAAAPAIRADERARIAARLRAEAHNSGPHTTSLDEVADLVESGVSQ